MTKCIFKAYTGIYTCKKQDYYIINIINHCFPTPKIYKTYFSPNNRVANSSRICFKYGALKATCRLYMCAWSHYCSVELRVVKLIFDSGCCLRTMRTPVMTTTHDFRMQL